MISTSSLNLTKTDSACSCAGSDFAVCGDGSNNTFEVMLVDEIYPKIHHLTELKLSSPEAGLELMVFVKQAKDWIFVIKNEFGANDPGNITLPRAYRGKMVKLVVSKSPSASFCSSVELYGCSASSEY